MTGRIWPSLVVAALFALHPLHAESVAWISQRKDVLITAFAFLSVGFYVSYVNNGGVSRYLLIVVFLAMVLMSKPPS